MDWFELINTWIEQPASRADALFIAGVICFIFTLAHLLDHERQERR